MKKAALIMLSVLSYHIFAMETKGLEEHTCYHCSLDDPAYDEDNFIVYRSKFFKVHLNTQTSFQAHVDIIGRHVSSIAEFSKEEEIDLVRLQRLTIRVLKAETGQEGINWCYLEGENGGAHIPGHVHLSYAIRTIGDIGAIVMLCNESVVVRNHKILYQRLKDLFIKYSNES